ncbi:MAG: BBP7 family outer membrane beta-barrel protein [Planctomycetaceae bacterium]|nr:BBP7 family outer membrane beta-barrel protein [Planctomycetaceae bacterium]
MTGRHARWWWAGALGLFLATPGLAEEAAVTSEALPDACTACCPDETPWTVRANAMFLKRSRPSSRTFLIDQSDAEFLNASQFDFPTQVGWELDLQRRLGDDWSVEGRYFNVGGQAARFPRFIAPTGTCVQYADVPLGMFGGNVQTALSYASQLQNVEFNVRRDVTDYLTLFGGFRYLSLNEGGILLAQHSNAPRIDADQTIEAYNDLYGFQVGVDAALLRRGRFALNSDLKAGLFDNEAGNRFGYESQRFGLHGHTGTSTSHVAFVGEIGLSATYALTQHLSLLGGYRLLWFDGVALATDQPSANPSPVTGSATAVDTHGDLFYHGAFVGVEFRR